MNNCHEPYAYGINVHAVQNMGNIKTKIYQKEFFPT